MARKKRPRGNGEGSICQRKDGRWQGAVTVGRDSEGRLKRVFFYGRTRQEVAERVNQALAELRQGTFAQPTAMTVGEWLDTWLSEYKRPKLRPTTWDHYETLTRVHLKPVIGGIRLKDLRPEHIQKLYNEKLKAGLAPKTIADIHVVVHGALQQALRNGHVARNVAEAVTLPRRPKKEIKPLTVEQVKRLFQTIEADRLFPAIYLELATGLRRGELLALRWQDVDLKAGTLTVNRGLVRIRNHEAGEGERRTMLVFQEPKTEASRRTIPIPEDALAELRKWKARQNQEKLLAGPIYQDCGLVFCQEDGRPIDPRNFTRRFEAMLRKAGLPHFRFHDARHTFATLMLELEIDPKVVQEMLGHSQISTTLDIYSHVNLDLQRKAAMQLNQVLKR